MTIKKIYADSVNEGLKKIREDYGPEAMIIKTVKRNNKVELFVESPADSFDKEFDNKEFDNKEFDNREFDNKEFDSKELDHSGALQGIDNISDKQKETANVNHEEVIHKKYREAKLKMLSSLGEAKAFERDTELLASKQSKSIFKVPSKPNHAASFDSILDQVKGGTQKYEKTVASLLDVLQLDAGIVARVRDCRRIDELIDKLGGLMQTNNKPARGIIALVGPAGSGKTTTLIKLIARQLMQFGPDSCAIINCDRYRSGAKEQLSRMADLLDVPVMHTTSEFNLNQAIAKVAHRDLVIIDMPGLSMSDPLLIAELFKLSSSNYDIQRYLVLPANLQTSVMTMALATYGAKAGTNTILTRLDECSSLGPVISFLIKQRLLLSYTTHGPHIPEDISRARGVDLVMQALTLADPSLANLVKDKSQLTNRVAKEDISDFTDRDSYAKLGSNRITNI